jgi:glyoxalase family protein
MPATDVSGLHHVTAVASEPQINADFYTDVLGLRLVKRTVNFDDTSTYHLYYGDKKGSPGTILTFFPFGTGYKGEVGRGQPSATSFVVPEDSVEFWTDRLDKYGVERGEPERRFDQTVIPFEDVDGQPLELVTDTTDITPWESGPVAPDHAIRGFHGVTLHSTDPEATAGILEVLGYERTGTEDDRIRFETDGERATVVDVIDRPDMPPGRPGAGTVHHIAFRTPDGKTQAEWRDRLRETSYPLTVTPKKDRQYFTSIYFREPGGILFEIATDGPGFDRDESVDALGSALKLPPWLEDNRDHLESRLPELSVTSEVSD